MWVYEIFVSVCARNTAAKWYLPHQEKQHLTQMHTKGQEAAAEKCHYSALPELR
jgi:hypothetical protein